VTTTGTPVRWGDLAWPDFGPDGRVAPAAGHPVGLVPVGATEQHGPHLPTSSDTLVAVAVCEGASALTGAPVLPPVAVGASFGHGARLPGTLSLPPETLADLLVHHADWAARSGIRRLLFVNAHAGNRAAIAMAVDHLRWERPDLRAGSFDWFEADDEVLAELTADGSDIHANRGETSVLLAVAPELVRLDRLADADDADRTGPLVFRYTADVLSTNGVTGRPSQASAELGRRLLERSVRALADLVERGRTEEPPLADQPPPFPTRTAP